MPNAPQCLPQVLYDTLLIYPITQQDKNPVKQRDATVNGISDMEGVVGRQEEDNGMARCYWGGQWNSHCGTPWWGEF